MSNQRVSGGALDAIPSTELMRQVLDEAKTLVRLETRLARDELASDLVQLKYAAIFGAAAAVLALLSLGTIVMAIVLAFGGAALVAVLAALVLLLGAAVAAGLAYQRVPRPPLARTRERLASDVKQLERHIQ